MIEIDLANQNFEKRRPVLWGSPGGMEGKFEASPHPLIHLNIR